MSLVSGRFILTVRNGRHVLRVLWSSFNETSHRHWAIQSAPSRGEIGAAEAGQNFRGHPAQGATRFGKGRLGEEALGQALTSDIESSSTRERCGGFARGVVASDAFGCAPTLSGRKVRNSEESGSNAQRREVKTKGKPPK